MGFWVFYFTLLGCLAFIPANIAKSKGREFALWYIYGFFLWIVALIHALTLDLTPEAVEAKALAAGNLRCPHCTEWIPRTARVCRHCGNSVNEYGSGVAAIGSNVSKPAEKLSPEQIVERLNNLEALKNLGAISDAEYNSRKAKLIEQYA